MASKMDKLGELEILPKTFPYTSWGENSRASVETDDISTEDGFVTRSKSGYVGMFRHIYLSLKPFSLPPILTKGYPYAKSLRYWLLAIAMDRGSWSNAVSDNDFTDYKNAVKNGVF